MNKTGAIIIEGHVQGLANTRALGKAGIPVVVLDKGVCVAASSKYCTSFYQCSDYKSNEFVDFLMELGIREDLKGWVLIPSNDHAVYSISKNLKRISEFYKTTIPNIETIAQIYDKAKLLELAQKVNIPIPKTFYFEDFNSIGKSNLKFPVLTKGKQGLDFYKGLGKKAFLAENDTELKEQLESIQDVFPLVNTFTQELIPFDGTNKTVSLAAFCVNGKIETYWMGVKLREHPLQFGTATFTESVYIEDCFKHSEKILSALNYTGVCEVEFLKDPRDHQYKLIEINARTWLWVGHAIANGVNFPLYIYQYLNGQKSAYASDYKTGVKWRNPFSDFIFSSLALLKGKIGLQKMLQDNRGEVISALWDTKDKKPFFQYARLMLKFLKNR